MAITSVTEIAKRSANGEKQSTTFERSFQVQTSDPNDGPQVVLASTDIPQLYSYYSSGNDSSPWARCVSLSVRPHPRSRTVWEVTAGYDTQYPDLPDPQSVEIPYLAPAVYTYSSTQTRRTVEIAYFWFNVPPGFAHDGIDCPITNSVGQAPEIAPEIDFAHGLFSIEKQTAQDASTLLRFINSINESEYRNCKAHTLKVQGFSSHGPLYTNGMKYWETRVDFEYAPETWDLQILNAGYMEKVNVDVGPGTHNLKRITTTFGNEPVQKPWPLKEDGSKMDLGIDTPYYNDFQVYGALDFTEIDGILGI